MSKEIENFHNEMDEIMLLTDSGDIAVDMGDLNGTTGTRNNRRNRLIKFCMNNFLICNSSFKNPRRLYTWKSAGSKDLRIFKN